MNAVERMMKEYGVSIVALDSYFHKKDIYPPFTAEKQIELIQLMGETVGYLRVGGYLAFYIPVMNLSFDNALAETILKIKDKLDIAKVKEILEK